MKLNLDAVPVSSKRMPSTSELEHEIFFNIHLLVQGKQEYCIPRILCV